MKPQFPQVLSGLCKAEKLACKADSGYWTKTGQQFCGNMTSGGDYQRQDDCHKTYRELTQSQRQSIKEDTLKHLKQKQRNLAQENRHVTAA